MQKLLTHLQKAAVLLLFCLIQPFSTKACDTSGFQMLDITDNGNGTFTIQWLVMAAGGNTTGLGSTYGFFLNVGAPIVSVSPSSLTGTQSGITLNGIVSGSTVSWGNPTPSAAPPFLNIAIHPDDEQFLVTIVVSMAPIQWNGAGQEGNNCPGGAGTGSNYAGVYPCFEPTITTTTPTVSLCAGVQKVLKVTPNHLVKTVTWNPGGQTGNQITITGTVPTTYTVTAVGSNPNCPFSLTIDVDILPQPQLSANNPDVEVCPNQPAILETSSQDVNNITWTPSGSGPIKVVIPQTSPAIYTATASNSCGTVSVNFTVITKPLPKLTVSPDLTICAGDEAQLIAFPEFEDSFVWLPVNSSSTEIAVSPAVTTTYTATATNECGPISRKTKVTVLPKAAKSIQLAACPGKTVSYNGNSLAAGSTSNFTFSAANGCDSVVTVAVVAKQNSTGALNLKACQNKTVAYGGQNLAPNTSTLFTLTNAAGCDSLLTVNVSSLPIFNTSLNLQACAGKSVVFAGQTLAAGTTTPVVLMSVAGCDSTVAVTVQALPNFSSALTLQTCPNKKVNYASQQLAANTTTPITLKAKNGCDSVVTVSVVELAILTSTVNAKACTGTTFPYNGQNLAPNSTTNFTFQSTLGCDSIVTVNVAEIQKFTTVIDRTACAGQSITHNGQSIAAGTSKIFNFTTALGCDSVVTVNVASLPTFSSAKKIRTCPGQPVSFAGQNFQPGSVTPVVLAAANGCDSTVTLTVEAIQVAPSSVNLTACKGETVFFGGKNLAPGTTEVFKFFSFEGCDSLVTVTVGELPTFSSDVKLQACQGFSASYNGQMLAPGTNLDFTFQAKNGCDSVVHVTVEEVAGYTTTLPLKVCPGKTAAYQGQNLAIGSVTPFKFTATGGCDSTVTVTVSALPTSASSLILKACPNESVLFHGQNLLAGTTTPVVLTGSNGCDSTVTVNVQTLPILTKTVDLTACIGGTATYAGENLAPGTQKDFIFKSSVTGCDSIVTVNVTALPPKTSALTLKTCAGVSVNFAGQTLAPGSVTPILLTTPAGCDSTVTVSVVIGPPITGAKTIETCIGQPVVFGGQTLQPNTTTPVVLKTSAGCDSTVTVTVQEVALIQSSVFLKACPGKTAPFNGQQLQPGSVQNFTFKAQNGCDSVVTVTVKAAQTASKSIFLSACSGKTAIFNGQPLAAGTTKIYNFQTWEGCDSTVTVEVKELFPQATTVNLQACTGTTVTYNGQQIQPNSTKIFDLKTWQGCDSTVTVNVAEVSILTSNLTLEGCEGTPIPYAGSSVQTGETKKFTFPSSIGCDSVVTVTAIGIPPAATAERVEICPGKTIEIHGIERGSEGFYPKTFVGANGCDSTHTVELAIVNPVSLSFPTAAEVDLGHETILAPNAAPPSGLVFSWLADTTLSCLDCPQPTAAPIQTTTYFLTVTDAGGCSASAATLVKVDRDRNVFIPNSFSPNDDGLNDEFLVFADARAVKKIRRFLVFSRWGESVHELQNVQPNDVAAAWNGRQRGKDLNASVFVYFAEIEFIDGVVKIYKGDVTIVE